MIKDIEHSNENITINDNAISILKEHFSSCFKKGGSFDMERFKEELKDKVDVVHEGYELKFLGKSYAKLLASLDTTTVITPNTEHNSLPENQNSENIYISGDNLDGLKHLLKSYSKSVKCIYIDPPYNTGSDGFVYKDNFNFTVDELQDKLSVDETQAKRILDLTKRNSASHSAWLMFMHARLQLAKDLLKDDGVIFISIDDNEQANLKLLCDDVFGEENFVGCISWLKKRKGSFLSKKMISVTEYILVYSKTQNIKLFGGKPNEDESQPIIKRTNLVGILKFPANIVSTKLKNAVYRKGIYGNGTSSVELLEDTEVENGVFKEEVILKGPFTWSQKNLDEELIKGSKIIINAISFQVRVFKIQEEDASKGLPSVIIGTTMSATNEDGYEELIDLFGLEKILDYPKPVGLLKYLITAGTYFDKDSIILDFFSGSATTADAVLQLNADDEGNRKFISVQLPEVLDFKNPSQKSTFDFLKLNNRPTTLDYVGVERIIRASKKIKEETKVDIDFGFKHFILNEPNQNTLDKCETFDKAGLLGDTSILDDFGIETVLTTWLNNDGYGLNANVETIDLDGYTAHYCKKHLYLINLDFTQEAMVALFEKYDTIAGFNPENIVLFGYSFIEWSVTEMLEKNLKILNDSEKNLKINIDVRY